VSFFHFPPPGLYIRTFCFAFARGDSSPSLFDFSLVPSTESFFSLDPLFLASLDNTSLMRSPKTTMDGFFHFSFPFRFPLETIGSLSLFSSAVIGVLLNLLGSPRFLLFSPFISLSKFASRVAIVLFSIPPFLWAWASAGEFFFFHERMLPFLFPFVAWFTIIDCGLFGPLGGF